MSGAFRVMAEDKIREERPTTRLVLRNDERGLLAHLSAMTVEHGGPGAPRSCQGSDAQRDKHGRHSCRCWGHAACVALGAGKHPACSGCAERAACLWAFGCRDLFGRLIVPVHAASPIV